VPRALLIKDIVALERVVVLVVLVVVVVVFEWVEHLIWLCVMV
jgi:hypothetical protein